MSAFPAEQIERLKERCDKVLAGCEGGQTYLILQGLRLPEGCSPTVADALLCPGPRDGYNSRLFFASQIVGKATLNWNGQNVRILERNWFAYSWKTTVELTLDQMLDDHLAPLR